MSIASCDPGASCEACERDDALSLHENPAGLQRIAYRVADHGRFSSRMTGWISRQGVPPNDPASALRPLTGLATRASDDPTLALIDAWACALDVLTFYQERIANECFLRTATERQSVLMLARAIGYELAPGVAASTRLAFTLLASEKAPKEVRLPVGQQVQSVPGPGERPQTFETVEELLAKPEWNAMRPVTREPGELSQKVEVLYLGGLSTGLRLGDKLLILGRVAGPGPEEPRKTPWRFRTVVEVVADKAAAVTRVRLDRALGPSQGGTDTDDAVAVRVFAFSERARAFGHNAPDPRMFSAEMKTALDAVLDADDEWIGFTLGGASTGTTTDVHLVGELDAILPDSWMVIEGISGPEPFHVAAAQASSRTDFMLSLATTQLTLDTTNALTESPRGVVVYAASRELAFGTAPIDAPIEGMEIVLEQALAGIEPGRGIIVQGPASADDAGLRSEVATVSEAVVEPRHGADRTVLKLSTSLSQSFERSRTLVLGNVARATHGKTVASEVLGSGDGSRAFQTFTLRQHPVTHVSSPTAGVQTTLSVRVGGVEWKPVSSTFGLGPNDTVYVARVDDGGNTTLTFGDGHEGARLPTGSQNLSASYRVGIGHEGVVAENKLSVLKTRLQGVKSVTNPLATTGAADAETLDGARQNAPLAVLTLDRLVSISDYENYARAYPGIGKAQAVRLWDGRRFWVHLTLATGEGAPLSSSDDLYQSLVASIDARRDPVQRVWFDTFAARAFALRASLVVETAFVFDDVARAVDATLRGAFSFAQRRFAQPVTGSEILRLVHTVAGVVAVDLDALWDAAEREPPKSTRSPAAWVLPASAARHGAAGVERAELLLLAGDATSVQIADGTLARQAARG
jgi:predicted phage baseplate assembly protein